MAVRRAWRLFYGGNTPNYQRAAYKEASADSCDRWGSDVSAERSKRVEPEHCWATRWVGMGTASLLGRRPFHIDIRQIALPGLLQLREHLWRCEAS
jgi:hypothetical protein